MSKVSVIGLGKLGSSLAAVYASKGHKVIGLDLNQDFVDKINAGIAPVQEPGLQALLDKYPVTATTSYEEAIKSSDTSFIIVPTPSGDDARFVNDYVIEAVTRLGEVLRTKKRYHLVVICSTTMPGSTDGVIREALETSAGRIVGNNLGLCYSPEFIALGSVIENMLNPDMVLIGESDRTAGAKLERLFKTVVSAPVKRMGLTNAEIAKIAVNTYITMKISFANMLAEVCENLPGGDAHVVANAIGMDSRIGRKYLSPGTAFGGPCFPRDTKAFAALVEDFQIPADLPLATDVVNGWQIDRLANMVGRCVKPSIRTGPVLILGTSYKPGTPVKDESPGLKLAAELEKRGYKVRTHDPSDEIVPTPLTTLCQGASVAVIMTPWPQYKQLVPNCFQTNSNLVIIDCWNMTENGPWDDLNMIRIGQC